MCFRRGPGADEVDLPQGGQHLRRAGAEVVAQRPARGVAVGDHDLAPLERADFGGGVAQVLALQSRQAVDLQAEEEPAEAEGAGQPQAPPAGPPDAEAGAEEDQQRHEERQQVAAVDVVGAGDGEQERQRQGEAPDQRRHRAGSSLLARPQRQQQPQRAQPQDQRHGERDRVGRALAVLGAVVAADQLRRRPFQPLTLRLRGDPAGVGVCPLLEGDRKQQRRHRQDRQQRRRDRAAVRPGQQQGRLGEDDEAGEVVGGEGEGREGSPPGEVPARLRAPGPGEEEE